MSLHKLFLFAKNTDASATERGFHYQKLKTLKTWLSNRIQGREEIIYCDYEEDIFERNIEKGKSRFRQIKLYSSNFSFAKEEIQKCISHFFMLFIKGEYKFDETEFVFEANSSIARQVETNDANLLREWEANQESLSGDLLDRCREKIKSIVADDISESYEKAAAKDKQAERKDEIQYAKQIFDSLTDETWDAFVKAIRWEFENRTPEDAMATIVEEITTLITQLPLPLNFENPSAYISILHFEIANRTTQTDETDRMLSNKLLDVLLLNSGAEKQKWYADVFTRWTQVDEISHFDLGAFLEVVDAARYCRSNLRGSDHQALWLDLLSKYIRHAEIIPVLKRKSIYEFIFLTLSPDPNTGEPKGNIANQAEIIRYYFDEMEQRSSFTAIKEDIILLEMVEALQRANGNVIPLVDIQKWADQIITTIDEKFGNANDVDVKCLALELKGQFTFHLNMLRPLAQRINEAVAVYRSMKNLLELTSRYSIITLIDDLSNILALLIKHRVEDGVLQELEAFIDDVDEYATKNGQQHATAHKLAERGVTYLNTPSRRNYVKALNSFHKAKDLWQLFDTKEGYILALINIAQVYSSLRMNIAAKYYGLCGVWVATHSGEFTTLKRISDSYAMVFHADFAAGAWISALDDFDKYFSAVIDFDSKQLYREGDTLLKKTLLDLSLVFASAPILHPALKHLIEFRQQELGWLSTESVNETVDSMTSELQQANSIDRVISKHINGSPLSDVGPERQIKFSALGVQWELSFENSFRLNGLGEEFGAMLQITLTEIEHLEIDFKATQKRIVISIEETDNYDRQITNEHDKTTWRISIPVSTSNEMTVIRHHYAYLAVNISLLVENVCGLSKDEIRSMFKTLLESQHLAKKHLAAHTYQKVYTNLVDKDSFEDSMRNRFPPMPTRGYDYCSVS